MAIDAEAWFLYAQEIGEEHKRGELVRETYQLPDPVEGEVLSAPLYGAWEGNMEHSLSRLPVDVARQRREKRIVMGNSGVVRVLQVGKNVTTVEPGQLAVLFAGDFIDRYGYAKLIYGYDAPGSIGCLSNRIVCSENNLIPLPDGAEASLARWGGFGVKYITAWSNWRIAYGTFRLLVDAEKCPAPHVWGWGGGTTLAELELAKQLGCRATMLSGNDERLEIGRRSGVNVVDRRQFGELQYDEKRILNDRQFRRIYRKAEMAFSKKVEELTDGEGVQIFVDNIGGPVYRASLKALGREGIITTAGWKRGMEINYLRASECITRHQFIHTHYAEYQESVAAVNFAAENGWLPTIDEKIYSFDDIPRLADDYSNGNVGITTVYSVNPV